MDCRNQNKQENGVREQTGRMERKQETQAKEIWGGGVSAGMQHPLPRPAPCTERLAQQNIQGHGDNLRGLSPGPSPQGSFRWCHNRASVQGLAPAPGPTGGHAGFEPSANGTSQVILEPHCPPKPRPSEAPHKA